MQGKQLKPIAILGAGSWGTALALYLGRRGQTVRLWSIESTEIEAMLADKANERYLPGISLPETIHPMLQLEETVRDVDDVLVVVPSVGFRQTLSMMKPLAKQNVRILCASKGLDTKTGQLLSHVAAEIYGEAHPFAVLSGPSFAKEVARGLPCAVMIASKQANYLRELTERFDSGIFRVHPSNDVLGVEAGGVVKNVVAIATGIVDGLQLGANTRSALITQGLAEIITLGTALGGRLETFIGLAGLGDLILTCSDDQSRNRRMGLAIGRGRNIEEAEREIGQVVEGKRNAELVAQLSQQYKLNLPVCAKVWEILQGKLNARDCFNECF